LNRAGLPGWRWFFFALLFLGGGLEHTGRHASGAARPAVWGLISHSGGRVRSRCWLWTPLCLSLKARWLAIRVSFPSRQGTLTQRMSSARGGPSDAIGPPSCARADHRSSSGLLSSRETTSLHAPPVGKLGGGHDGPRGGRITSKVRRVWVVNGTACAWRARMKRSPIRRARHGSLPECTNVWGAFYAPPCQRGKSNFAH